jgi:hypothetical protein
MRAMKTLLAPALLCASLNCGAQTVAPASAGTPARSTVATSDAPAPAATPGKTTVTTTVKPRAAGEPEVRHIVIEDDGSRIDELRVRSVPQRIVVTSKGVPGGTTYEIITGDGSRDLGDGANTSRGAAGKRVWRVLNF